MDMGTVLYPRASPPPIIKEPSARTEVKKAFTKLKGGWAVGTYCIPAELLKSGGEPSAWGLYTILKAIW